MNKKEYMQFHEDFCKKMIEVTKAKNADYSGAGDDPFANFRHIGNFVQTTNVVSIGFLTRMSDKFSRIGSFISNGTLQVKDESVEDTLHDLANYAALFAGYLRSERMKTESLKNLTLKIHGVETEFKVQEMPTNQRINEPAPLEVEAFANHGIPEVNTCPHFYSTFVIGRGRTCNQCGAKVWSNGKLRT